MRSPAYYTSNTTVAFAQTSHDRLSMDTVHILCTLRDVRSFLGVFPSDLLPRSGTVIINVDPQTEKGSHWLADHFLPRSYTSHCFESDRLPPFIPAVQTFVRCNRSVWNYNSVQLQGPTSTSPLHQIASTPDTASLQKQDLPKYTFLSLRSQF